MMDAKALKPLKDMKKTLSFQSEAVQSARPWPQALLPIAFQGELLCGFNATCDYAWELQPGTELTKVGEIFLELHPDLSFVDLFLLQKNLKVLSWGSDFFKNIIKQMASNQEDQWFNLLENLSLIPDELILQWQQKRLQFGDLRPLLTINGSWSVLIGTSFSKSEWTQVIEWFTELSLMEKGEDLNSLASLKTPREMILKLKELRYPETTKRDRLEQDFWKKLPWPKNTQAEFRRQGDQTKTYVSMNFGSVKDLKKISKELFDMAQKQESEH